MARVRLPVRDYTAFGTSPIRRFEISNYTPLTMKNIEKLNSAKLITVVPYGLAVRIPGFHPGGPGSTPGMGPNSIWCYSY